jgi:hypothetical protein
MSRFTQKMQNLKQNFKEYLNSDRIKSLDNFESYFLSNAISVLSLNFSDYYGGKDKSNKKREYLAILYCIFGWMAFFRFSIAAFINDSKLWTFIGDPFYLIGDRVLFNLLVAAIALNATSMRTIFLIGIQTF